MLRKIIILLLAIFIVSSLTLSGFCQDLGQWNLQFGSASATGNWRVVMTAISKIITDEVPGVRANAQVCPAGETESVMGVRDGIYRGGAIIPLMAERFAKGGNEPFIEPFPVHFWFNLGDSYWYPLVAKSTGITKIEEFPGHRIAIAAPGSVNHVFNTEILFPAHGFTVDDIHAELIDTSTSIEHLKDGNIDGLSQSRGFSGAFIDLTMARDIVIAQPSEEAIKIITEQYPWAGPAKIPQEWYPDLEIPEPGVWFIMPFCSYLDPTLPEDLVYYMTKAVFENFEVITSSADAFKDLDPMTALNGATKTFPPHKGALKYYKEINIPGWEKFAYLLD